MMLTTIKINPYFVSLLKFSGLPFRERTAFLDAADSHQAIAQTALFRLKLLNLCEPLQLSAHTFLTTFLLSDHKTSSAFSKPLHV